MQKCLHIFFITKVCTILAYCCLNLVVMATLFVPLKIWIAYFKFMDPEYPTIHRKKFLDFLHTTEISAILADFCLNLVAMATPFAPLKIPSVYSSIRQLLKPYYSRKRFLSIQNRNLSNFALSCLNLVAMATALAPLKFPIACSNLPTRKTLPYMQQETHQEMR